MPLVLMQHGGLATLTGKTGLAMLRHRSGPIVAVIDPDHAGQRLEMVTGIARQVPVVGNLIDALAYGPKVAVVGLAPSGGVLPAPLRADVLAALRRNAAVTNNKFLISRSLLRSTSRDKGLENLKIIAG